MSGGRIEINIDVGILKKPVDRTFLKPLAEETKTSMSINLIVAAYHYRLAQGDVRSNWKEVPKHSFSFESE